MYLTDFTTIKANARAALSALVETKFFGADRLSPRLLHRCSNELALSLTKLFEAILRHNKGPRMCKFSNKVATHIKGSRSVPSNYRPVSGGESA